MGMGLGKGLMRLTGEMLWMKGVEAMYGRFGDERGAQEDSRTEMWTEPTNMNYRGSISVK
jgi:hypothetical protein